MTHEWKRAWRLSRMELKRYIPWFLLSLVIYVIFAFILGAPFHAYMDNHTFFAEDNFGLYDAAFLFLFFLAPYVMRPKMARYQQMDGVFYGSPYFIKLLQLPVPERIIIKNRFVTYMMQSIPFQILFLLLFYVFAGMKGPQLMSPFAYIAFSIIWVSFGIYGGHAYAASDAGDLRGVWKMILYLVIFGAIVLGIYGVFKWYSPYGLVEWTVVIANRWPVLSSIISIIFAVIGMRYWMHHMRKTMNKMDYLS